MEFSFQRSEDVLSLALPLLGRLGVALICGALIGIERGRSGKPAGVRTNILICVGAAIYAMASELSAKIVAHAPIESARITAQVVTGVGFIGAGAILRSGLAITGLTTAATIWLVAAIGVVVGLGFPILGVGATAITLLTLIVFAEVRIAGGCEMRSLTVRVPGAYPIKLALVEAAVHASGGPAHILQMRQAGNDNELVIRYCTRHPEHSAFLAELDQSLSAAPA